TLLSTLFLSLSQAMAFHTGESAEDPQSNIHAQIINDALANKLTAVNLSIVEKGSNSQDKRGSEAAEDSAHHFADNNFRKAAAYIDRQKKLALDYAATADTNETDRARALYHFGLMLHTVQDFYSQTNYIEITVDHNRDTGKLSDPYNIQLIDWNQLPKEGGGNLQSSPEFSKSSPATAEGQKALAGSTYFAAAKELAVKETLRQWQLFESLIKMRYPQRANAILTAIRHASCAANLDVEKLAEDIDVH
ncbi:MAG TPA: hypothetical protein V6C72_06655, partial [Chroococcales cyanobacterium]